MESLSLSRHPVRYRTSTNTAKMIGKKSSGA